MDPKPWNTDQRIGGAHSTMRSEGLEEILTSHIKTTSSYLIKWKRAHFKTIGMYYANFPLVHKLKKFYSTVTITNGYYLEVESVSLSVMSDSFVTPVDCSPPGSSVHGILQTRILE